MSENYNPNSIQAVLSRIETTLKAQDVKLANIEANAEKLWRAHSNLRVKVAGIAAFAGIATAALGEWLRSLFAHK